jgi:hypothetical protein
MRSRVCPDQLAAGGTRRAMAQIEACQLAGDRGGDDIGRLAAAGEFAIARAQIESNTWYPRLTAAMIASGSAVHTKGFG